MPKSKLKTYKEVYKNNNLIVHNINKNKKNYYFDNFHYFEYESLTEYRINSILLYSKHKNGLYKFNRNKYTNKLNSSILNITLSIFTKFLFDNMHLSVHWIFNSIKYKNYNIFNIISYNFVLDAMFKENKNKQYYYSQSYIYHYCLPKRPKFKFNAIQSRNDINVNYEFYNKFFNFYFFFYNFSKDYFLTTNYIDNYNFIYKKLYSTEYNFLYNNNINYYNSILNTISNQLRKEPYFQLLTKKKRTFP